MRGTVTQGQELQIHSYDSIDGTRQVKYISPSPPLHKTVLCLHRKHSRAYHTPPTLSTLLPSLPNCPHTLPHLRSITRNLTPPSPLPLSQQSNPVHTQQTISSQLQYQPSTQNEAATTRAVESLYVPKTPTSETFSLSPMVLNLIGLRTATERPHTF